MSALLKRMGEALKSPWGAKGAGVVLVTVLALLASLYRGVPISDVELHDGGVWVTNGDLRLLGHLNYPSRILDGGVAVTADAFDVHQSGGKVALEDQSAASASLVDPAAFVLGASGKFSSDLDVVYGGDTVAVTERATGKVWGLDVTDLGAFSTAATPLLEEPGAKAIATVSGNVVVVEGDGSVQLLSRKGNGFGEPADRGTIRDYRPDAENLELSAVGDEPVVLDHSINVLHTTKAAVQLPGTDPLQLQQVSADNDRVILATVAGLLSVPLNGDQVDTLPAQTAGRAVQPVFFQGCIYAAWMDSGEYLRDCPGDQDDVSAIVPTIASAQSMSFRMNRDVIVLNDLKTGIILLVNENMQQVDNWTQVQATLDTTDEVSEDVSENDVSVATDPEDNTDPIANPDDFGVRPGRANWLPVLANDQDPDGDILTAEVVSDPEMGTAQRVSQGEALQIVVPEGASGSDTFSYRAEDGRGGSSEAPVTVTVHGWETNTAPKPLRYPRVTVAQGGSITYNLVNDWFDPDGDLVFLDSAGPADGTSVEFRADGTVTIRDLGTAGTGMRSIPVVVTDGRDTTQGEIQMDVREGNQNQPPIANSDHYSAKVGQSITVSPLANDSDPNGDQIRLVSVEQTGDRQAIADPASGTVRLQSQTAGSYYVNYSVSDRKAESTGMIRFDVFDPGTDGLPPAAQPDIGLLPPDGSVLVDLTVNDSDPMGGVLVVQSIQVPDDSGLSVQLIDHHLARIAAPSGLDSQITFSYTVSNGHGDATADVVVIPLPVQSTDQPPTAVDDAATVRAGDVTTVDVLANDISPAQLSLEVAPDLSVSPKQDTGVAFVSDNKVRFRAGPDSGTVRITYTIRDTVGGFSSATVVMTVVSKDDPNDSPSPNPLNARTFAGTAVRIAIPTVGVDPDGDSVVISGLDMPAATMGPVTIGEGFIEYTPNAEASGTDVFGYTVMDRFGAVGTGLVYVGVSPLPAVNQSPFAQADIVNARPERKLAVPVTVNDFDPDGDQVQIVADSVQPVDGTPASDLSVEDNRIELTTPALGESTTLRYYYDVSDGRGGSGRGLLTINVSPEAPLLYPVARDDAVAVAQTFDQDSVVVDVLANDEDPDGASADLRLASSDPGVSVTSDGKLEIPVAADRQVVVYSVTDQDDQTAFAVVSVPGEAQQRPILTTDNLPVTVTAGELLELKLPDYVRVRSGHSPKLTFADLVQVTAGSDGTPPVKDDTTLQFRSTAEFVGPAAIQFEVTDGSGAEDPDGLKSVLSIPIIVEPRSDQNKPPEVHPSQVNVVAGEAAARVDLAPMISDPDDPDKAGIKVALQGVGSPFEATLDGLTLAVSAPAGAAAGTPGSAVIEVTDNGGETVTAAIPLQVVSSTRPLLAIAPIAITDAKAGQPSTVNLDAYVTDPFAADGKPFTIVGEPTVALGNGLATASGHTITVTPAAGFSGQLSVSFRLADATNDAARQVTGTITATVRDKPAAPTNVSAASTVSKTVDVSWSAGAANGAPISGFEVRWTGENGSSGSTRVGAVTSTQVSGLTNNVWYTFTVIATNEVGDSEPSAASNQVRPDTKPDTVGAPTGKFGDRQIEVTWPAGTTDGAPIDHYEVSISPAPGGVSTQVASGSSLVWTGLTNGTAYSFTVVAVSVNNLSSDPSAASAPEVPAGAPLQSGAPNAVKDAASALAPSATISWPAADGNGDSAGLSYELRQTSSGAVLCTGAVTSCHVTLAVSGTNQTFEVRATNKSQLWSEWSPVSNAIRPFQPPSPVTGLTVTPTGANNTVRIDFTSGELNGAQAGEVTYYWQANGASGAVTAGQTISNGVFVNGQNVSVSVYPVSSVNGETTQGDSSGAVSANAYGPPNAPSVSAQGGVNSVTLPYNASGSGNGRPITEVETNYGSGRPVTGQETVGSGRGQTYCIRARAKDQTGLWGAWSGEACASTWQSPTQRMSDSGSRASNGWWLLNLTLERWDPNSRVYCSFAGSGAADWNGTFNVNGDGWYSGTSKTGSGNQDWAYVAGQTQINQLNNGELSCRQA